MLPKMRQAWKWVAGDDAINAASSGKSASFSTAVKQAASGKNAERFSGVLRRIGDRIACIGRKPLQNRVKPLRHPVETDDGDTKNHYGESLAQVPPSPIGPTLSHCSRVASR